MVRFDYRHTTAADEEHCVFEVVRATGESTFRIAKSGVWPLATDLVLPSVIDGRLRIWTSPALFRRFPRVGRFDTTDSLTVTVANIFDMTAYADVRDLVAESDFHEWIRFVNRGDWTYQPDVALRLSREEQLESRYTQPWTNGIQGTNAAFGYYVYYGSSPVEYHVVVSVDDGRAHIPEPRPSQDGGQYVISSYEATIGRIVSGDVETFNAYLNQTNVTVQD